jgi:NAD(P)-dependent dehydrogenase (short-subunit alcohol dehydrogenase family)
MNIADKFNVNGKVALITGAGSGIGKAAAKILVEAGASVIITDLKLEKLIVLDTEIKENGGICEYYTCDISVEENCKAIVEFCKKTFGRLDIVVNSAGTSGSAAHTLEEHFNTDNFNKTMAVDFNSIFYIIKYAYPENEKNGGGSIINICSIAAIKAAGPVAYTAAKGAIKSLTRLLGKTFGPMNIRINSIYPGLIETEMTAAAIRNPQFLREQLSQIPLGRVGQPDDIANCVLYLASDASSFVTGQDFIIDGGSTC